MASPKTDKYRSFLYDESEKDTKWSSMVYVSTDMAAGFAGREGPESAEDMGDGGLPPDWKTMVPDKLTFSLNENLRVYDPATENFDSSHVVFTTTFPRGFAIEILQVYSGPPTIVYKFRHWGYMEGSFKGHAPTGERVELFGMGIFHVDEEMKIEKVELFLDRGELLGGLLKGGEETAMAASSSSCPFIAGAAGAAPKSS
ncbi:hypothetical protein MLD38_001437 [Melastoma candidum]|uniref:Uncharacterized protein n=1 Tax=Melastoma candidum TaxID=119954 RepID=A0ACB9SEV9_9MYRT|nr:hypothetical protein MLD38_001437 [Melastoma candidum]